MCVWQKTVPVEGLANHQANKVLIDGSRFTRPLWCASSSILCTLGQARKLVERWWLHMGRRVAMMEATFEGAFE